MNCLQVLLFLGGVASSVPFSVGVAWSDEGCPRHPLGVTSQPSDRGETFYATASVRPFRDDDASLIESKQDARSAARLLLRQDKRVPLGLNGQLRGAIDEGSCVSGGRVYSSVSINAQLAAEAIELDQRLRKSLATRPAPQIPSYSWISGQSAYPEMKEIDNLLRR